MGGKIDAQIVGYRYYIGFHISLTHGPIDKILEVEFDQRPAFSGVWTGGQISIDSPYLFGGDDREGGVSGVIELFQGGPNQVVTGLIRSIYNPCPGFRGVVTLFANLFYFGNNPYLKPMRFRISRIHVRQEGQIQWYDEKSEIPVAQSSDISALFRQWSDFTGAEWQFNNVDTWEFIDGDLRNTIASTINIQGDYYRTTIAPGTITNINAEFMITGNGIQVGCDFGIVPVFRFWPAYFFTTPAYRPAFTSLGEANVQEITASPLTKNIWHRIEMDIDTDTNSLVYRLIRLDTQTQIASGSFTYTTVIGPDPELNFFINAGAHSDRQQNRWRLLQIYHLQNTIPSGDMNPAHIMREIITDTEWGMGYREDDVDDTSFIYAADFLYNERLGLSFYWNKASTIEKFREEVLRHINAELYVSRSTGKFVLKLIRPDYDVNAIPVLDQSNILKISNFTTTDIGELTNSITVRYNDRSRKREGGVSVQDPALAQIQGVNIHQNFDFPGIRTFSLASRIATRELRAVSTPLATCTLEVNREASDFNKGDPFILNWPKLGIQSIVMRVVSIDLGDGLDNKIKIQAAQDVFSMPDIDFVTLPEETFGPPTIGTPEPADPRLIHETPYYGLVARLGQSETDSRLASEPDLGYLAVGAARPSAGSLTADVIVDAGGGYGDPFSVLGYFGFAILDSDISYLTDTITATQFQEIIFDPAQSFPVLNLPMLGSIEDEIVEVTAVDYDDLTGIATITATRAALDTVPVTHSHGAYLLLWGPNVYTDEIEYLAAESLDVKILPIVGGNRLLPSLAPVDTVVMDSRAIRPYPPGNVTLDGQRYPTGVLIGPLELDWSHRDRLQQTASIIDQYQGDIGPESSNVTYTIRVRDAADILVYEITGLTAGPYTLNPPGTDYADYAAIELLSVRDGYESWQAHRIDFYWLDALISSSSSSNFLSTSSSSMGGYFDLVIGDGPTAYWRMEETGGTTMVDQMGSYNGTYANGVTLNQPGAIADSVAAQYDGVDDCASVPHNAGLNAGSGEWCVEFFMKFTSTVLGLSFGKFNISSPFTGPTVFANLNGGSTQAGYLTVRNNSDIAQTVVAATTGLNDGSWRHYVCQRRLVGAQMKLEIYINGVLDATKDIPTISVDNTDTLYVGSRCGSQRVAGTFDEVAFYVGKALTPSRIAEHFAASGL